VIDPNPAALIRRLRAQFPAAEDENGDLRDRLAHALEEIRQLRAQVDGNAHQAAASRE
jgi:hypothetical protein